MLSDGSGNAIKNATAADIGEVADKVIFYFSPICSKTGNAKHSN